MLLKFAALLCLVAIVSAEQYYDIMKNGKKEWRLAFKGVAHTDSPVYAAYLNGSGVPANGQVGDMRPTSSCPSCNHYRNNDALDKWANIDEVAFIVYKDNIRVKEVIFDGTNTNYMNWFAKDKVKSTTWGSLISSSTNYFSIPGDDRMHVQRRLFINQRYNGCPNDCGYFVAMDADVYPCDWEIKDGYPVFKYSKLDGCANWNNESQYGYADTFVIFLKYKS